MRDSSRILRGAFFSMSAAVVLAACSTSSSDDGAGSAGTGEDASSNTTGADGSVGEGDAFAPGDASIEADTDTGVDAGPPPCTKAADCASGVCNIAKGECLAPTPTDGVKNGTETDIDCGGSAAPKCDIEKKCSVAGDCTEGVCADTGTGLRCQAPTPTDGVQNGNETDVDCGGTGNPACDDTKKCVAREDCTSQYCKLGICKAVSPSDGDQNGTETDIDCGGPGNPRCNDLLKCAIADDCKSDVCLDTGNGDGLRCQVPTPTDTKKNGTETDVDCGGVGNPACAKGKTCLIDTDCASQGCNYDLHCAARRSCKAHYGGDTCGFGGAGSVGPAQWEDCCATAPVKAASGPTANVNVELGKYQVTGGRMRVFLEAIGYNVRDYVKTARAAGKIPLIPGNTAGKTLLEADWDMYLPTSFDGNQNADELADCTQTDQTGTNGNSCKPNTEQRGIFTSIRNHLGGTIFKGNDQSSTGCFIGAPGTHVFRFPDDKQDGQTPQVDQNEYDTRSMQCIPYLVAQAFCVWDGGRLELGQEWLAAWGPGAMPWQTTTTRTPQAQGSNTYVGCRFPTATDANHDACGLTWDTATKTIEYADYQYSYEYPARAAGDYIVFISAPGRTRGRGPAGHADIIGMNYGITSNVGFNADPFVATHGWNSSGSWEVHGYSKAAQSRTSNLLNKYGKLGLRCAYP